MGTNDSQLDELIAQMTPEEKAGQLTQHFYFRLPAGAETELALPPDIDGQPAMLESSVGDGGAGCAVVRHRSGRDQPSPTARRSKAAASGSPCCSVST